MGNVLPSWKDFPFQSQRNSDIIARKLVLISLEAPLDLNEAKHFEVIPKEAVKNLMIAERSDDNIIHVEVLKDKKFVTHLFKSLFHISG